MIHCADLTELLHSDLPLNACCIQLGHYVFVVLVCTHKQCLAALKYSIERVNFMFIPPKLHTIFSNYCFLWA